MYAALFAADKLQSFTSGHDGNSFDLCETEQIFFVSGDDQVGIAGDCRCKDRIVPWIGGEVYLRRIVEDEGVAVDIVQNILCFIGVDKFLQARPRDDIGYLGDLRGGRYEFEFTMQPRPIQPVRRGSAGGSLSPCSLSSSKPVAWLCDISL